MWKLIKYGNEYQEIGVANYDTLRERLKNIVLEAKYQKIAPKYLHSNSYEENGKYLEGYKIKIEDVIYELSPEKEY